MQRRRDFLKFLGLALGASFTGCGGGGGTGGTGGGGSLAPLAYRFVPLISAGGVLPRSRVLAQATGEVPPFLGGVMINDRRHVCFHANDEMLRKGVFEIDYDVDGNTSEVKHLLQEGDVLPDGTVVDDVSGGYFNNQDELVFVVTNTEDEKSVQVSHGLGPFEPRFQEYDSVSSGCTLDGDLQPEVGLADNGDLLFVCCSKDAEGTALGEALFYTPQDTRLGTVPILTENELLPSSNCAIRTFGFCEIGNDGSYLVQGCASVAEAGPTEDNQAMPGTYLAHGHVGEAPEVLVADPSLGISGAIQGSVNMGARLGEAGFGFVCQTFGERTQLYLNRQKLLEAAPDGSGSTSPRGHKIVSLFPPVFGPHGLMLVQVFTVQGTEILAWDGFGFSSLLGRGDVIGGKRVEMILFGCLPHGINAFGEFVAVVEYADGESAVLVGMPV